MNPQLEESWKSILQDEFSKDYMLKLKDFLVQEKQNITIYPKGNQIFEAFQLTPFNKVKVVILGQDPYHGPGQAHGLSFSVPEGIPKPPSLENIFKEIQSDLGIPIPKSGSLVRWAEQGVLLLNAILTVRASQAASHRNQGWEQFTDAVLHQLNEKRENLVFMLWGNFARSKSKFLDPSKHCILESVHPSPLSAYQGFLGCKHFSSANQYLKQHGISPIQW